MDLSFNTPERFLTPLAYSPKGKPVFLIGGGDDSTEEIPLAPKANAEVTGQGETSFSKADLDAAIEKARKQEKDKLYSKVSGLESKLAEWDDREKERQSAEAAAEKERKAADKAKSEEDLSAKELLERREKEWQSRFDNETQTWEQKFQTLQEEQRQREALLEKEKEFATLAAYTQRRISEEADSLAPELVDYINGNSADEVEKSIEFAKAKSAKIAETVRNALVSAQQQQRGVSPTGFPPVGPLDMQDGQKQYSPEDIANMDMKAYAEFRNKVGIGRGSNNRGMFG